MDRTTAKPYRVFTLEFLATCQLCHTPIDWAGIVRATGTHGCGCLESAANNVLMADADGQDSCGSCCSYVRKQASRKPDSASQARVSGFGARPELGRQARQCKARPVNSSYVVWWDFIALVGLVNICTHQRYYVSAPAGAVGFA